MEQVLRANNCDIPPLGSKKPVNIAPSLETLTPYDILFIEILYIAAAS